MSYRTAQNLGFQQVFTVLDMLNKGAKLEEVAQYLGCSKSRASRKINALFRCVWVPEIWTEDYLKDHAQFLKVQTEIVEEGIVKNEVRKALILPMVRSGNSGKKTDRRLPKADIA